MRLLRQKKQTYTHGKVKSHFGGEGTYQLNSQTGAKKTQAYKH